MSVLKWIKENLFDWFPPVVYRGIDTPEHPPGWRKKPAKKRAKIIKTHTK